MFLRWNFEGIKFQFFYYFCWQNGKLFNFCFCLFGDCVKMYSMLIIPWIELLYIIISRIQLKKKKCLVNVMFYPQIKNFTSGR